MSIEVLGNWLGVCGLINIGMLMLWFAMFVFAHDWMYKMHTKWFKMSVEAFDTIHYSGMGLFKLFIFVFNIIPFLALMIAS
ncbi:MAG: hypothetical protein QGG42_21340 [Phycisphaerae bacterium]|jgi:hypothetical protein|nr:hypothetical protein [Phycisphaerae bacterium]